MRALPSAVMLLAAGCTLYEAEPHLSLTLESAAITSEPAATVRVDWPGGGTASVLLEGRFPTEVRVGESREVWIDRLGDGVRRLQATVEDRGRIVKSETVSVRLDRVPPRLAAFTPSAGAVVAGQAFTATAIFTEPVTLLGGRYDGSLAGLPFEAIPAARATTIPFGLPPVTGPCGATLHVVDDAGHAVSVQVGPWSAQGLDLYVESPREFAGETAEIVAHWPETGPAELEVQLDGGYLGMLDRGGSLAFDTRPYPEGPHVLTFLPPGYVAIDHPVVFDRTPPTYLGCGGFQSDADDMAVGMPVVAFLSDASAGGAYWITLLEDPHPLPLPATWHGEVPVVTDAAGSPAGPWECSVRYPLWRAPAGPEPLDLEPAAAGSGLAVTGAVLGASGTSATQIQLLARFGGTGGSRMYVSGKSHGSDWSHFPARWWGELAPLADVGEPVTGVDNVVWLERSGGAVEVRGYVGMNLLATLEGVEPVSLARPHHGSVGWIETTPAGEGRLRAAWEGLPGPVTLGSGQGSHVTGAALVAGPSPGALLTEATPPAAPAQLREQREGAGPGPSLNLDPTAAASDPVVVTTATHELVAWVEAERVLARARAIGEPGWSDPVDLRSAPDGVGRLPALSGNRQDPRGIVAFVETTAGGDGIELRAFDGTTGSWSALPSLPPGGPVDALSLAWPGVLWRTTARELFFRAYNE